MQLVIFRHGIAQDREDPASPPEAERRLTPKGIRRTRQAARGLRALGVDPSAVLSSPYVRARETADIALDVLGLQGVEVVETEALLPDAPPGDLLRVLERLDSASVLCAGHAPHVDVAIAYLLGAAGPVTELKKAGAACFDVSPRTSHRGKLLWLLEAKTLRRLS
jgi:phosphohistidine phosphatase